MNEKAEILVCTRIVKGRVPELLSVRERCTVCGAKVWRATSSPEGKRIVCVPCAIEIFKKEEEIVVAPPSEAQLREIRARKARGKN
jgi:hypothetical protein